MRRQAPLGTVVQSREVDEGYFHQPRTGSLTLRDSQPLTIFEPLPGQLFDRAFTYFS